ncbi:TPA: pectin esterase [Enterococcus faecium]|nr:pectin esterase [Enterococcus faecium]
MRMKDKLIIGKNAIDTPTDFETIQEGIDYLAGLPDSHPKLLIVKEGRYDEYIESRLSNFKLVGAGTVVISGNRFAKQEYLDGSQLGTFRSATFFLEGSNVVLENLHIENTAGPGEKVGQAVALFNSGDRVSLKNCRLSGYQDTLCTGPLPDLQKDGTPFCTPASANPEYCRQTYEYCWIEGTVDFIFGGADAVFHQCHIHSLASKNPGYITAASTPKNQKTGYRLESCTLTAEPDTRNVYLGRPWRPYANVLFEACKIGGHVHPTGWDNWDDKKNEQTIKFSEHNNNYETSIKRPEWIHLEKQGVQK